MAGHHGVGNDPGERVCRRPLTLARRGGDAGPAGAEKRSIETTQRGIGAGDRDEI